MFYDLYDIYILIIYYSKYTGSKIDKFRQISTKIDKNRQRMIQEEINYKEEMQRNITQAIDTMSTKNLIKLFDSLNKVDDIYSNKLTEKQKEKEWRKNNPEKVKQYNENYWNKKAEALKNEES